MSSTKIILNEIVREILWGQTQNNILKQATIDSKHLPVEFSRPTVPIYRLII